MKYDIEAYKTIEGYDRWIIKPWRINGSWYIRSSPFKSETAAKAALLIVILSE